MKKLHDRLIPVCYAVGVGGFPFGVKIELTHVDPETWAVREGCRCLSKSGLFDYEPMPSSREDEWLSEHRFASPDEAFEAFVRCETAESTKS